MARKKACERSGGQIQETGSKARRLERKVVFAAREGHHLSTTVLSKLLISFDRERKDEKGKRKRDDRNRENLSNRGSCIQQAGKGDRGEETPLVRPRRIKAYFF